MLWYQKFWDKTVCYWVTDGAASFFKRLTLADECSNILWNAGTTHQRTEV